MSRKACAAQTYNACSFNDVPDFFLGELSTVSVLPKAVHCAVLSVIFYDNRVNHSAIGSQPGLNSLHYAGNRADYIGRNKTAGLCNHLALQHLVALFHQRTRRSADVLGQRENHLFAR